MVQLDNLMTWKRSETLAAANWQTVTDFQNDLPNDL